jgi:serine/threonine-protein kinase
MMYTLASGRLVHDAPNAIQVLMKAAQQPARSLGVLLPETPFKIIHVVDRALAFDKANRWPSAVAMRDAIAEAIRQAVLDAPLRRSLCELSRDGEVGVEGRADEARMAG